MMNEKKPIELMADLLAAMTIRATEAERQRDEAEERERTWYQNYLRKEAELKQAEAALAVAEDKLNKILQRIEQERKPNPNASAADM